MFLQQLVNGLTLGCVYALIALGYTMVYGILGLINFAHGEVYMVGAYLGFFSITYFSSLEWFQAHTIILIITVFMVSMTGCGLFGVLIDAVAYRPLRKAPRLAPLITAVGVSLLLQNSVMLICGSENKSMPSLFNSVNYSFAGASISEIQIFIILCSLAFMLVLQFFVKKTMLGKAMQATAQNQKAASLMGISVNRIISSTFFIGSALGAAAGIMVGMYYGVINFFIGYSAGLKAFAAAVLGGIGSIPGAMLGGILLGIIESLWAGYVSSDYASVIAFVSLIIVLIFRPAGLMGDQEAEKV